MAETIGGDGRIKDRTGIAPQGVVMRATRSADLNLTANVDTVWVCDTKIADPFGWLDTTTGRFTPKVPGYYHIAANLLVSNLNGQGLIRVAKNGVVDGVGLGRLAQWFTNGAQQWGQGGSETVYLNGTTDYVELHVFVNAAGVYVNATPFSAWEATLVGVSAGVVPEPWHVVGAAGEPAFQNSWVNYDTTTYYGAGFFKDPSGIVRLRGLVKNGTISQTIFALPTGYRPSLRHYQATLANDVVARCAVNTDGTLIVSGGSNVYASLDGITFRAEQ